MRETWLEEELVAVDQVLTLNLHEELCSISNPLLLCTKADALFG